MGLFYEFPKIIPRGVARFSILGLSRLSGEERVLCFDMTNNRKVTITIIVNFLSTTNRVITH